MAEAIFLFAAEDKPGLVARLSGYVHSLGLNIVDSSTHSDRFGDGPPRFFMRLVVDLGERTTRRSLEDGFAEVAGELGGTWSVGYTDALPKVAILVTREPSCLYDLLLRQKMGELRCEVPLVISNREELGPAAASFGVPFYSLPVTPETKREQEQQVLSLIQKHGCELVVLARYMQVVSEEFLNAAPVAINIHHGFLPAFQGARPYHQAHERGVKIIGATAHYVTKDLDQGPIIEQDVARVSHELGPEELVRVGRDVERIVLARAVRAHLERRILIEGRRTIVL